METVFITGASRGIGLHLARRFAETGRRVVATARDPHGAPELRALASACVTVTALDVACAQSVEQLRSELAGQAIDVLINNAGIHGGESQGIESMDYADWMRVIEVNTIAPFRITTALLSNLRLSPRPRVITLSSQMGALHRDDTETYAYCSSKAAVNKVMRMLAVELAPEGIIVCPIHPGWVRTDMGGPHAPLSVEESADGIVALIDSLTMNQSGRFLTWSGDEHPW